MGKCFCGAWPVALLGIAISACSLASCSAGARKDGLPAPESEQVIGEAQKDLYMAAAAAAPHSLEQQKLILRMAQDASNGRELLLAMRAAFGVFPSGAEAGKQSLESQVRATVTAKMIQLGTLDQLIEYAAANPVGPDNARPYVQRMFQLGDQTADVREWYRIKTVALHLKVDDLEQQAEAGGPRTAGR